MIRRLVLVGVVASALLVAAPAHAAVHVSCDADALAQAVADANNNSVPDTLKLASGCTYVFTDIGAASALRIEQDLTIVGNGATILRNSTAQFRLFNVTAGTSAYIDRLTIIGGHAQDGASTSAPGDDGGGIINHGTLTLDHVTVTGNVAGTGAPGGVFGGTGGHGGGIFNDTTGTLTLISSKVTSNVAGDGAVGSTIAGTGGSGGGIDSQGTLKLKKSKVADNRVGNGGAGGGVPGFGGGILIDGSTTIADSVIKENDARSTLHGGGIYNDATPVVITPVRTTIRHNNVENCAPANSVKHCIG